MNHYEPDLQGVDKPCSSCGRQPIYRIPPGITSWCCSCGALSLYPDQPIKTCFVSASGFALAFVQVMTEDPAKLDSGKLILLVKELKDEHIEATWVPQDLEAKEPGRWELKRE